MVVIITEQQVQAAAAAVTGLAQQVEITSIIVTVN